MKLATIAVAGALAMSSTFAFAQMGGGSGEGATVPERSGTAANGQGGVVGTTTDHQTTGMGHGTMETGTSNGTAGGPTSLSGTGSSKDGGQHPGATRN